MVSVIRTLFFIIGVFFFKTTLMGQTVTFETENGLTTETICRGEEIQLDLTLTGVPPGDSYTVNWEQSVAPNFIRSCRVPDASGDCNFLRVSPTQTTVYDITVFGTPMGNIPAQITITVEQIPDAGLDTDIFLCGRTGVIDLLDELDGGPDAGGTWSNGTGTYDTSDPNGGTFTYTVSGSGNCPEVSAVLTIRPCGNEDPDGDNVVGSSDDDKDNDGIPNSIEDGFCTGATTTPIFILEEDFGFGGPSRSKYSEGLGLTYNPTLPQDTNNDGEYNVATSTFFRTASGNPETFLSTDLIGDVDANGDVDGRYLAINMRSSAFADAPVFIARDLPVNPGVVYDFSMSIASLNNNVGEMPANLTIEVVDQVTGTALFSEDSGDIPNGTDNWILVQNSFTAPAGVNIVTIRVINRQNIDGDGNDIGIDNVFLSTNACDFDRDGIPNSEDLDSDNDGIYDIVETGNGAADTDGDGRFDGPVDADGVSTTLTYTAINSDGDTNVNFLDIDSDNDGIIDNIEAQSTAGYIPPSGLDGDFNGVDDVYDSNGSVVPLVDSNTNGIPDYQDLNSDPTGGDCLDDTTEAYDTDQDGVADVTASGTDTDMDGLDDAFDVVVLDRLSDQTNAINGGTLPTDFPNNHNPTTDERDWREEFSMINETESVDGCSGSTMAFDLFDELTEAAIPGGTWMGPAGSPPLTNGEQGTFTPGTNDIGDYVYTLPTFGSCPTRTGTVTVNLGTLPDAGGDGTLSICRNDSSTIFLINSLTMPDPMGSWEDPNGDVVGTDDQGMLDPEDAIQGTYVYTVGTTGCEDTAQVDVTVNTGADPGEDGAIALCSSDATVNLFDSLNGTKDTGGVWTGPSATTNGDQGTIDPATAVAGEYVYTVSTTACPTPATATVTVTIDTAPELALNTTNGTSCAMDRMTYDISYTTNGNWTITITPNVGTIDTASSTITGVPVNTDITINAVNAANTSCEATLVVSAPNCDCPTDIPEPINSTVSNNDNVCFGDPNRELMVSVGAGLTANWYDEDGNLVAPGTLTYTPTVSEIGTYSFFVEAFDTAENCPSDQIEILYNISESPEVELLVDGSLCVDETGAPVPGTALPFIDTGLSAADYTFQWSFEGTVLAETGPSISAMQVGEYIATVTDVSSGCSESGSAIITSANAITPGDLVLRLSNGQFANSNDLIAEVDGDGEYEYSLDGGPFQQSNVFRNVPLGLRTVTVVDVNGCGDDEASIKVFGFPAFFTPNGDNRNDTWNVEVKGDEELPPMDINIFDRFGKLMKKQLPTEPGWDGTFNGEPMPSTDYWYSVQLLDGSGTEYRGHFNLRR